MQRALLNKLRSHRKTCWLAYPAPAVRTPLRFLRVSLHAISEDSTQVSDGLDGVQSRKDEGEDGSIPGPSGWAGMVKTWPKQELAPGLYIVGTPIGKLKVINTAIPICIACLWQFVDFILPTEHKRHHLNS